MDDFTHDERVAKIADLIKDIRVAMFATIDQHGHPRSRPMATQNAPVDGSIWFLTYKDSAKIFALVKGAITGNKDTDHGNRVLLGLGL